MCRIRYLDLHSDIDLYDVLGGPTMDEYYMLQKIALKMDHIIELLELIHKDE